MQVLDFKMRCLMVDDNQVVGAALKHLIETSVPFLKVEVVSFVGSPETLIKGDSENTTDLLFLNLSHSNKSAKDVLMHLKTANQLAQCILVITGTDDPVINDRLMASLPTNAYLFKNGSAQALVDTILELIGGCRGSKKNQGFFEKLPSRKKAIFDLVMHAYSNKKIASTLGIAEGTVKNQMYSIMKAASVISRAELVLKAEKSGYQKISIENIIKVS